MQRSLWLVLGLMIILVMIGSGLCIYRWLRNRRKSPEVIFPGKEALFARNCLAFHLSGREVEVLDLILLGRTYREVGEKLFISEKTVDSHMRNIYDKVGVRNKLSLLNKLYT